MNEHSSALLLASSMRGFNYQPSYAFNGADLWRRFDAEVFRRELGWGRRHFPKMNALRIWLAWDVFADGSPAQKEKFLHDFDTTLSIASDLGVSVMPVLFNRWNCGNPAWGGVYLDHFLTGASWANHYFEKHWRGYIEAVIGRFAKDPRIAIWDLCNEPFSYFSEKRWQEYTEYAPLEQRWLEEVYAACKTAGAQAPLSVGFWAGIKFLEPLQHISDVLNFHRYWMGDSATKDEFRSELDKIAELSRQTGKPAVSSECCWGSLDNSKRAEIIDFHLGELNQRGIGWLIYALQHSHIADLHWPEYGLVNEPGTLHCVEPDGTLREGHGVINKHFT